MLFDRAAPKSFRRLKLGYNFCQEYGLSCAIGLGWGDRHLNSDSVVNSIDLGLLLMNFGFESGQVAAGVASATAERVDDANASLADHFYAQFESDADEEEDENSFLMWQS